jgi:hypothetical protein
MTATLNIDLPELIERKIVRLTEHSHDDQMDLNGSLPWADGVNKGVGPRRPDTCTIYGTPAWGALSPEQRHQLAWEEAARDVSTFIWLEQTLPPLYIGYINKHGHLLPDCLKDYLLVFSREEIVHVQVFRRYMEMAGLQVYSPPEGLHDLYVNKMNGVHPVMGLLGTMLVEWVAENATQHATNARWVEPLTRKMFRNHHREELRHISFARWVIGHLAAEGPPALRAEVRKFAEMIIDRAIRQYTVTADVATRVPFDLGFKPDDAESVAAMRRSPNNLRINGERFGPILAWLHRHELVSPGFTLPWMPAGPPADCTHSWMPAVSER